MIADNKWSRRAVDYLRDNANDCRKAVAGWTGEDCAQRRSAQAMAGFEAKANWSFGEFPGLHAFNSADSARLESD